MPASTKGPATTYDFRRAAGHLLQILRRDRDRQILAARFGFDMNKRQTLEKIGQRFGITRERVRQIEKAAIKRLATTTDQELAAADQVLSDLARAYGGIVPVEDVIRTLEVPDRDVAYVVFMALLAPHIELIEESDDLQAAITLLPVFPASQIHALAKEAAATVKRAGQPVTLTELHRDLPSEIELPTLEQLCRITKALASLDDKWGLAKWPEVNPKSIRDKTYLVLARHGQPLHFSDIAGRIKELGSGKRDVTVQAVHNELIKDARFILIGRGIYALAEWGYTPGTVADIITEVLHKEQPLHKDEIIKRVLQKRQVKTTTIILNLQEKDQFVRTAKATYKLKD